MRLFITMILAGGASITLPGCQSPETDLSPAIPVSTYSPTADRAVVELYRHDQEEQAIIRQHALYPYHFVEGGAELNAAGHRDVTVLARHFAGTPGSVSLRRGGASDELYGRRVETVLTAMADAGVDDISVTDELPGGDGLASSHVLLILERAREGYGKDDGASSQSTMGGSGASNSGTGADER